MTNRTFKIAAWLFLVAIFVATDGPISFRPRSGLSPNEERFLALGVVGFLFSLAYPRRLLAVFGFGDAAPASHADPRYLHVALQAQGDTSSESVQFECWFAHGDVQSGRDDGIAWHFAVDERQ